MVIGALVRQFIVEDERLPMWPTYLCSKDTKDTHEDGRILWLRRQLVLAHQIDRGSPMADPALACVLHVIPRVAQQLSSCPSA
ncbi:hypothetical protein VTO73DRAFT_14058 [Trametes versicolor]